MTKALENRIYSYDIGTFSRRITTKSSEAEKWFNRGLLWTYAFNHQEAIACFKHAIAHDESCAMAYWGLAFSLGPHYNRPWESFGSELEAVVSTTYQTARKAQSLATDATTIEKALIKAIQIRYQSDRVADMDQYAISNVEYADAMKIVYQDFSDDLDVITIYADALISLTPWKLWDLASGGPNPGARTIEAKSVLETGFLNEEAFKHPGILHMYIHLIEMSAQPEMGLKAANCLRNLVPDAGHLSHMPSHIDILVGDYESAICANQRAVAADEKFLKNEGALNFYSVYRMHNYHSLIYAAMFAGKKSIALDAVERMEATLPKKLLLSTADLFEVFTSIRWHVMVRFGMWGEIIQAALPSDQDLYCVTTAVAHYAKAVAWAASKNVTEAERERAMYRAALDNVPPTRLDYPNKCNDILAVASAMLDGEIEYRRGNHKEAFEHLRLSVELDDTLGYSEPWGWMQPARHAYAALLSEQGHIEEAAEVYRADLGLDNSCIRARQHPNNVWALHGYHECLLRLGYTARAREVEIQLRAAVDFADAPVTSSCFCRLNTR